MTKKGYKLKQGQIVTGKECLLNGERPEYVIIDEFTESIDKHTDLTIEDLRKAYKYLNLDADNCKKCGTKKDWVTIGYNKHYCKCKADKLCKDPRVQQQMQEIEKLSIFRCMPKAICKIE